MVDLFELLVCFIEDGTALLFMSLYLGFKFKGAKRIWGYIGATSVSVALITYLNSLYINEGMYGLLFTLIYFAYALIFLKGDIYTKFFLAAFTNTIMYIIPTATLLIVLKRFPHINWLEMGTWRIFIVFTTKAVFIIVCALLLKFKMGQNSIKTNKKIVMLMPVVSQFVLFLILGEILERENTSPVMMLTMLGFVTMASLTYYSFMKVNRDIEIETEKNALLQKYEADKKHAGEVEELYSKTCSVRHDMANHFEILARLVENDKEKAKEYIESVTKNQINELRSVVKTGNMAFDAVINSKIAVCEKNNIKVQVRVMNNSVDKLKSHEIGIIFSNLFDNAIEGCENAKEKRIELDVQTQGIRTSIVMKNTIQNSVLEKNKELNTTKSDKSIHGFGVKNIRTIVDSYGGMMSFFEEDGYFGCDILI